jgi:hypothetical protein
LSEALAKLGAGRSVAVLGVARRCCGGACRACEGEGEPTLSTDEGDEGESGDDEGDDAGEGRARITLTVDDRSLPHTTRKLPTFYMQLECKHEDNKEERMKDKSEEETHSSLKRLLRRCFCLSS